MIVMLLAMLCWNPVAADCDGGPEPVIAYLHEVAAVRIVATQPCGWDEAGDPIAEFGGCPVYWFEPWTVSVLWSDPCLPMEPPDPGPGEVVLLKVTAFDLAGNADCGT